MKTFVDLTNQQLLQLHTLAQGGDYTRQNGQIENYEGSLVRVKTGP